MIKWVVWDSEADGLKPTQFYCICYTDYEGKNGSLTSYEDMREFFKQYDFYIAHNCIRWDLPNLKRVVGIEYPKKIIDSLPLSWTLFPEKFLHGLEKWGEYFGIKKPEIEDWENLSLETYVNRCSEDVKINTRLWYIQWAKLIKLYGTEEKAFAYIDYLSFKMHCSHLQEKSKWKLDVEYAEKSLEGLKEEQQKKTETLKELMPKVPVYAVRTRPKRFIKKDLSLTAKGQEWLDLLDNLKLPADTEEVKVIVSYDEPNPASTQQVKDYLFSLGWKPRTFEFKDKKEIPQINQKHGKGICNSVKELYEKEPRLEVLEGLSVLNHRISILEGFLETQEEGYVTASIAGLTNTLRFKHSHPCVNLPKPDRLYAEAIRTSLIADHGQELCGADMSSLEDRLKQHFIYPLDPEYVKTMLEKGFDPHLTIAEISGMMSHQDVLDYKNGDKSKSRIRDMAKNTNYALN